MAYNSMNAMLMGGIVPSQITKSIVDEFIKTPFTRERSFKFGAGEPVKGKSWYEVIAAFGISQAEYNSIVDAITNFLRASSSFGLIGGPNSLLRLRTARVRLIQLKRPAVDLAIRIMKDMRKPTGNRMRDLRTQFYDEADPLKAMRFMQFAPGFSYYDKKLTPLPKTLQERLAGYRDDDKRFAAMRRAYKRLEKYPDYTPIVDFKPLEYDFEPESVTREAGDFGLFRPETTDEVLRARAAKARETRLVRNREFAKALQIPDLI